MEKGHRTSGWEWREEGWEEEGCIFYCSTSLDTSAFLDMQTRYPVA